MRLRRPLPAVQGDTLHIVGVGDNRIGKDPLSKVTWKGLISEVAAALPREKRPCHLNLGVANTFVKWNLTSAVHVDANIPLGPNGTPDIELLTGISVTFGDD